MRAFDWIALAFFLHLLGVAAARRRFRVAAWAAIASVLVLAIALGRTEPGAAAHDWIPALYLLAGYWLPAGLVRHANTRLERALRSFDRLIFGAAVMKRMLAMPAAMSAVLEGAYLFCYPLVPLGFVTLWLGGDARDVERYWTAVLLAGFACYGMLPWTATRPPWLLEPGEDVAAAATPPARSRLRRLNAWVLARASVHWNTFPSGHVATATAIALTIAAVRPREGIVLAAIAAGIAAGSVIGRYHYAADALTGAIVGAAAFAAADRIVGSI